MRYVLLLVALLLMSPNRAAADRIGVYSDATGASCNLVAGFNTTATVIHQFAAGTRGSRFSLEFPAGSFFFSFTPAFPPSLPIQSYGGIAVDYGQCLQGSIPVGTITAILTPGALWVRPADGFLNVMFADCELAEKAATCGGANIGSNPGYCPFCEVVATDQKTWGAVKSLYR